MPDRIKFHDNAAHANLTQSTINNCYTNLYYSSKTFQAIVDYLNGTSFDVDVNLQIYVDDTISDGDTATYNKLQWQTTFPNTPWPGTNDYSWVVLISPEDIDGEEYSDSVNTYRESLESLIAHEITHVVQHLTNASSNLNISDEDVVRIENQIMAEAGHWPEGLRDDSNHDTPLNLIDGSGEAPKLFNSGTPSDSVPSLPLRQTNVSHLEELASALSAAISRGSPIILDLDDSGTIDLISLANSDVFWDFDQDGFREHAGWVDSADGLLALDINGNGRIDDNGELFGTMDTDGFTVLGQYDSNADGKITAEDAIWSDLIVWQDSNENAYSEATELHSLDYFNIISIDLDATEVSQTNQGHDVTHTSAFTVDDGINPPDTRIAHDVWFEFDNMYSVYTGEYDLDLNALLLNINLRGFGDVPDLHIALSQDNDDQDPDSLISLVTDFSDLTFAQIFDETSTVLDDVRDIMYRWAGVDGVSSTSRGVNVDARELEFLEAFVGQDYSNHLGPTPGPVPGLDLQKGFHIALNNIYARLVAQAAGGELFTGDWHYDIASDAIVGVTGLDSTQLAALETEATALSTTAEKEVFWDNVVRMVEYSVGTTNLSTGDQTALDTAITNSDSTLDLSAIVGDLAWEAPSGSTYNGTTGDDTITAGTGDDTLNGSYGNDTLYGDIGNDTIDAGAGDDIIWGEGGQDYLKGGSGNDEYHWEAGDGWDYIIEAGTGTGNDDDRIVLGTGFDSSDVTLTRLTSTGLLIDIDNGTDTGSIYIEHQFNYAAGGGHVELIEFADSSTLDITAQDFTLTGTSGADILWGAHSKSASSVDTIYGGDGNDTIYAYAPNSSDTGANYLYGEAGNDTLYGSNGADELYGGAGDDYIRGGSGDDLLNGGTGEDTLWGEAGDDTFIYTGGHQTFYDTSGTDEIQLDAAFNSVTPSYYRIGDDLQIFFDQDNTITLIDHCTGSYIEDMVYADTTTVDLTTVTYLVQGDSGNNTLNGGSGDDTFFGFAGDDTLNGNGGADYLDGGAGDDTMNGGSGNDHYFYVSGHDTVYDTGNTDILEIAEGWAWEDLTIYRNSTRDMVIEINGSNSIFVNDHFLVSGRTIETLRLNDGSGDIAFSSLDIETQGSAGNDSLYGISFGGSVNDVMYGYAGNDYFNAFAGTDKLYGGDGDDDLRGGDSADELYGENDDDRLQGDNGDDYLDGGSGDDTLEGGADNDHYFYSSGHDVVLDTSGTAEIVELSSNWSLQDLTFYRDVSNDLRIDIDASNSIIFDYHFSVSSRTIETLRLNDGTGDITLSSMQIETYGNASNNTIHGITFGGSINDIIYGYGGNDYILSGDGDDILYGGTGDDDYNGGTGDDLFVYSAGLDAITENYGADTLWLTGGITISDISVADYTTAHTKITINSGVDEVVINYQQNANSLYHVEEITFDDGFTTDLTSYNSWTWGTTSNNVISATTGDDTIIGMAGDDTIQGNAGNDDIHGGAGTDTLKGGAGDDLLHGGVGTDTADYGGAAAGVTADLSAGTASDDGDSGTDILMSIENLTGSAYADTLTGDSAANTIKGGAGNDTLTGASGADTLYGEGGADTFAFDDVSYTDVVKDFDTSESDILDISDILTAFDPLTDTITDWVEITDNGTDSYLAVDVDGGADNFVQIATIEAVTGLTDEAALVSAGTLVI